MLYDINTPHTIAQSLNFVKVSPVNLPQALQIQARIWPQDPPDHDYRPSHNNINAAFDDSDPANIQWLVYHHDKLIGLTGVFTFDSDEPGYDDRESIWMDRFAVLPEQRGHGYGKQILLSTMVYAKSLGSFKYFRLDSIDYQDCTSTCLYDEIMSLREDYTAEPLPHGYRRLVYSYSLDGSKIKPWNNQLLSLNDNGAAEITIV